MHRISPRQDRQPPDPDRAVFPFPVWIPAASRELPVALLIGERRSCDLPALTATYQTRWHAPPVAASAILKSGGPFANSNLRCQREAGEVEAYRTPTKSADSCRAKTILHRRKSVKLQSIWCRVPSSVGTVPQGFIWFGSAIPVMDRGSHGANLLDRRNDRSRYEEES